MLRKILSVFAGIASAILVFILTEKVSDKFYPLPSESASYDPQVLSTHIATFPLTPLVVVLIGWVLGSFTCGFIIKLISGSSAKTPAYLAGLFLTTAGLVNLLSLPHPIWFIIMGAAVFIPFTLLGHVVAPKKLPDN